MGWHTPLLTLELFFIYTPKIVTKSFPERTVQQQLGVYEYHTRPHQRVKDMPAGCALSVTKGLGFFMVRSGVRCSRVCIHQQQTSMG